MKFNFNRIEFKGYFKPKAIYVVITAVVLLIVGTFLVWAIGSYIASISQTTENGVTVQLGATDHSASCTPLPNTLTDNTAPDYTDCVTNLTITGTGINGKITMPRFQGKLNY